MSVLATETKHDVHVAEASVELVPQIDFNVPHTDNLCAQSETLHNVNSSHAEWDPESGSSEDATAVHSADSCDLERDPEGGSSGDATAVHNANSCDPERVPESGASEDTAAVVSEPTMTETENLEAKTSQNSNSTAESCVDDNGPFSMEGCGQPVVCTQVFHAQDQATLNDMNSCGPEKDVESGDAEVTCETMVAGVNSDTNKVAHGCSANVTESRERSKQQAAVYLQEFFAEEAAKGHDPTAAAVQALLRLSQLCTDKQSASTKSSACALDVATRMNPNVVDEAQRTEATMPTSPPSSDWYEAVVV